MTGTKPPKLRCLQRSVTLISHCREISASLISANSEALVAWSLRDMLLIFPRDWLRDTVEPFRSSEHGIFRGLTLSVCWRGPENLKDYIGIKQLLHYMFYKSIKRPYRKLFTISWEKSLILELFPS